MNRWKTAALAAVFISALANAQGPSGPKIPVLRISPVLGDDLKLKLGGDACIECRSLGQFSLNISRIIAALGKSSSPPEAAVVRPAAGALEGWSRFALMVSGQGVPCPTDQSVGPYRQGPMPQAPLVALDWVLGRGISAGRPSFYLGGGDARLFLAPISSGAAQTPGQAHAFYVLRTRQGHESQGIVLIHADEEHIKRLDQAIKESGEESTRPVPLAGDGKLEDRPQAWGLIIDKYGDLPASLPYLQGRTQSGMDLIVGPRLDRFTSVVELGVKQEGKEGVVAIGLDLRYPLPILSERSSLLEFWAETRPLTVPIAGKVRIRGYTTGKEHYLVFTLDTGNKDKSSSSSVLGR